MGRKKKPTTAVRDEINTLPENLQDSALAAAAYYLAEKLEEAGLRDTPPIARELRATLMELHELANRTPEEDDPVAEAREQAANRFSNTNT